MNVEDLQAQIAARIAGDVNLAGITTIVDDGVYPLNPGREAALSDKGLVIIIWPTDCDSVLDSSPDGSFVYTAAAHLIVEENVSKNRATVGYKTAVAVARLLGSRLAGSLGDDGPGGTNYNPSSVLLPMDPWFKNFGITDGINRVVVSFSRRFSSN